MFGCFTRNIYVSKICWHFLCAFELSHDSLEERKDHEWASLCWGVLVLSSQESIRKTSSNVILFLKIPVKFGVQQFWCRQESCEGAKHHGCLFFFIPSLRTRCFFNLLNSICTYKQCLQRNTFTGVDWLFHNYPYLEWHGTLTVISHIKNVSDPSRYKVHWPEYVWAIR